MAVYSTSLNTKILEFKNRSQTKMGKVSELITYSIENALRPENYQSDMETAYFLGLFNEALDSNENDWTDKEIERFIDIWTAKARLNEVPYFEHNDFNIRITIRNPNESLGETIVNSITILNDPQFNTTFDRDTEILVRNITTGNVEYVTLAQILDFDVDIWFTSKDSANRFYFANGSYTIFGSPNGYQFKNSSGSVVFSLNDSGNMTISAPSNDNALVQVLVRDSSTGEVKYRTVASLGTDLSYTAASRLLSSSTGNDVTIPLFTSTEDGLTPASGGETNKYLRADGVWDIPVPLLNSNFGGSL